MMTSNTFNEIVGQSTALMRNFCLKISPKRKWDYETLVKFERKHQRVKLQDFKSESVELVVQGLNNIGRNVKNFELLDCGFLVDELIQMFNTMENLTSIVLTHVKATGDDCDVEKLPEFNSLTRLKIVECNSLFGVFLRVKNLHEICFEADLCKNSNLTDFELLLKNQKKLKTLALINIKLSNFLEKDDDFPFRLKSLTINQCHFNDKEILENFLRRQDKLEEIDLTVNSMKLKLDRVRYFDESLSIVMRKKSLRSVTLDIESYTFANMNFLRDCVNENVENLSLSLKQTSCPITTILKTFPYIHSLELSIKDIDQESIDHFNENMPKLNSLKVTKFPSASFGKLKLKNLKSLHVNETNIQLEHWMEFLENHLGIVKLIVNFTFFVELSDDFIDIVTKKLKLEHLELIDKWIGMSNEIYVMICDNSKSLKYLKLWNINVEKDFDDNDKEFLRSRNIRFHLFNDESLNTPMVPF